MRVRKEPRGGVKKTLINLTIIMALLFLLAIMAPAGLCALASTQIDSVPHIDSVDPAMGFVGSEVTIHGSGFEPSRGGGCVTFTFGAARATDYTLWTDTEIRVRVPKVASGEMQLFVTTNTSSDSNKVDFTVVPYGVAFAEGYTGDGFQEFMCIGNPQIYPADVEIMFLFPDGTYLPRELTVGAGSRVTLDVNKFVGPGEEVSAIVFSDVEVVVERPMYFSYGNGWTGGHDVIGTPYMSKLWFFAEGYTGPGFDEWVCVLNSGEEPANLKFHFQVQGAGEFERTATVPPLSRRSYKVNDLLGRDIQCSLALESDQYVVAERSMYFDYLGAANRHWEGGHCVTGLPYLTKEYYFSEGATRDGFEEWITLQNPNPEAITVTATYQLGAGQGEPVRVSHAVPPQSRETVYVPNDVGMEKDVSVKLSSSHYFLAERPMYFRYTGYGASWEGGHCVMGAIQPASEWFFGEGYTGSGFNEWLCLQNPGDSEAVVEVDYYTLKAGQLPARRLSILPGERATLMVNENAGPGYELSTRVRVVSGSPIVAERPMYFMFRGWDGGHDVVGSFPEDMEESASQYHSAGLRVEVLPLPELPLRVGELRGVLVR